MDWLTPELVGLIASFVALVLGRMFRDRVGESEASRAFSRYSNLRQAAFDAVMRVEQEFKQGVELPGNAYLKERAVETASQLLSSIGIQPSASDLAAVANLIEVAVLSLKGETPEGGSAPIIFQHE